jgi:FkbM family methyltransferase
VEDPKHYEKTYARKSYSQLGEDVFLAQRLRRARNGLYVDVGAYHPFQYSNTELLRTEFGWTGVNIDACSAAIDDFKIHRNNEMNICAAVGDYEKAGKFYSFKERGYNTTSQIFAEKWRRRCELLSVEDVQIVPLSLILNSNGIDAARVKMLNLDISGSELDVLVGIDWNVFKPDLICISSENLTLRNLCENRIYLMLSALGYKMVGQLLISSIFEREFV